MANGEVNEFDIMRQRIRERQLEREKAGQQQVKTQFATRGTLGSGAEVRAQERERARVAQQAQEERRDVLIAEAGVRRQEREAQRQREFARQERLGQQEFQAGQAQAQRRFLTGERVGTQQFQRGERLETQQFTKSQAEALQAFSRGERIDTQEFAALQAELDKRFAAEQAKLGRDLTASESLAQRKFLAKEAQLNRELTVSERKAQNAFASAEAALARGFSQEERQATQAFIQESDIAKRDFQETQAQLERDLKERLQTEQLTQENLRFIEDMALKKATLAEQTRQFNQETKLSTINSMINATTALKTAGFTDRQIRDTLTELELDPDTVMNPDTSEEQPIEEDVKDFAKTIATTMREQQPTVIQEIEAEYGVGTDETDRIMDAWLSEAEFWEYMYG